MIRNDRTTTRRYVAAGPRARDERRVPGVCRTISRSTRVNITIVTRAARRARQVAPPLAFLALALALRLASVDDFPARTTSGCFFLLARASELFSPARRGSRSRRRLRARRRVRARVPPCDDLTSTRAPHTPTTETTRRRAVRPATRPPRRTPRRSSRESRPRTDRVPRRPPPPDARRACDEARRPGRDSRESPRTPR